MSIICWLKDHNWEDLRPKTNQRFCCRCGLHQILKNNIWIDQPFPLAFEERIWLWKAVNPRPVISEGKDK